MRSKWIFITIFSLTILDIACTYSGLQSGLISEANPLMVILLKRSQFLTYAGILAIVSAALYFIYKVRTRVRWLPGALSLILAVKVSVILLHFQWILTL